MNFDESTDSMDSILIANILNNQNTKLLYIYDFMNMWTFYVELIEEAQEINNILYPRIIFSVGNVPEKAPDKKYTNEDLGKEDLALKSPNPPSPLFCISLWLPSPVALGVSVVLE